jgi:predicted small metal-binding protein
MKTITCAQLGGICGQKLSAYSWDAMVQVIAKHLRDKHPKELEKKMRKLNVNHAEQCAEAMKPKWDAAPEQ